MIHVKGTGGGVNIKDATAIESDVLAGKTFYAGLDKNKKTGTLDPVALVMDKIAEIQNNITYSGTHEVSTEVMNGVGYVVYTLISSGTLSVSDTYLADLWLSGGGAGGNSGSSSNGGDGGNGGSVLNQSNVTLVDGPVTIGAAGASDSDGGATVYGGYTAAGGTRGGWTCKGGNSGNADGDSTKPFRFDGYPPLSAGGGGGCTAYSSGGGRDGGNGGTNGGEGLANTYVSSGTTKGGLGGYYGGGDGYRNSLPTAGTEYGAGGGGGRGGSYQSPGAAGYQGCMMFRIPITL